ncbi:MAG TPA: AMP-binding protein [Gammaproteobacteria bacterium]|nr:AMP-binding protein [Gammaproteobacteria bacterium]
MDSPANIAIFAHLIDERRRQHTAPDILTFVDVTPDGRYATETRSYQALWDNGQRVAAALAAEGLEAGGAFAIMLQNHPEFVDAMVGSSVAGTVFVPIDPRTRGKKLAYMLTFAECRGVIVGDYALPQVLEVLAECPTLEWAWVVGARDLASGPLRLRAMADVLATEAAERPIAVTDPDAPMQMLYTSGTTGDPKAILSPYSRFATVASLGGLLGLREGDRPYSGLSLTHANAQLITLGTTLHMGLRAVFSRRFTKSRLWDIVRHHGCTMFNLLGGMTTAIYSEPERPDDADNPVRYVLSAGMPSALWEDFARRFGVDIFEFYGAAEGGLTFNPPGAGPVGSIGKPPPTLEGRIVDEEDRPCPPRVPGEIVFRNADGSVPRVAYFKNPTASEDKMRGGWLRMGDIGYQDEQGWYYFLYRKGGGIRHNADFINPGFVEKELAEHPLIDDVFVYGVTSSNGVPGEKDVVAAIVPVAGQVFDASSVFAWCRARLESNFVPTYLQVVPEIPKTASEKPQERFLLDAFAADAPNVYVEKN